jgi:hypothetical protein
MSKYGKQKKKEGIKELKNSRKMGKGGIFREEM